ncbi:PEP/pyruvate-binding domain-containing protein, partial [Streptococcus gordonii]
KSASSTDLERMEAAYRSGELDLFQLSQQLQDWAREQLSQEDLTAAESWVHKEFSQTDCRFAVRSSATIEDGKASSFAGQFESQLNVKI